jgi:RNA polymerase-binding protein DksA
MDNDSRRNQLRALLLSERDQLENRVKGFRRDQAAEALAVPGDEMDRAKSMLDVETHASLIARAEDQLLQIDSALQRVDDGRYGICVKCGEEISLARLEALPFTPYCVDCKSSLGDQPDSPAENHSLSRTEREAYRRWTPPPDVSDVEAKDEEGDSPADELEVKAGLGPDAEEEGSIEVAAPGPRRRRSKKNR